VTERTLEEVLVAIMIGYEMFSRLRDVMRFSSLWMEQVPQGWSRPQWPGDC